LALPESAMLRAVLVVAALLLSPTTCQNADDEFDESELDATPQDEEFDENELDQELENENQQELETELDQELGLYPQRKKAFLVATAPATTVAAAPPTVDLMMGRHPSVARKLGRMNKAMRDLSGRQQAAALSRSNLEDNVQKAVHHMNEAVVIKRELARTDALLRTEETKLRKLEEDRLRLDRTHSHLVSSLQHIMTPKIQFAETRLKQRQRLLHNLEEKAAQWKEKETKFHDASLAMIEERKEVKDRVEAANAAVEKARHEQLLAKKELKVAKHDVAFNVEGYRYAQTRARASVSEEQRGEQVVQEAEFSVKRLSGILNMEQRRVDESMAVGKDRVRGKIRELDTLKQNTKIKEGKLSKEYMTWQRSQRHWAARVAANKQITREAASDYAIHQRAVLDAAQAKVAYDAESDSDWAWDGDFTKGGEDKVQIGDD